MKIIFSKNNNYFLERNAGIEPTASNWNVRILPSELIPRIFVPEAGVEPARALLPRGFSYHIRFYTNHLQHYLFRCCSLDYFFTILKYISTLSPIRQRKSKVIFHTAIFQIRCYLYSLYAIYRHCCRI